MDFKLKAKQIDKKAPEEEKKTAVDLSGGSSETSINKNV